jgi:hypothetical protein
MKNDFEHRAEAAVPSRRKFMRAAVVAGGAGIFSAELAVLLLIRLFQHATICSVGGCRARHFQRIWASFSVDSRPKRPASSIWRRVAGRRVSRARAVDTGARTS